MSEKKPDYMILVNEENRLPEDFASTIELIDVENAIGEKYQIEKKTYQAFLRLREDILTNNGLQIELISVYRTVDQQKVTFNYYVDNFGLEYAKTYAALPGCSEHHTGFAIDVSFLVDGKIIRGVEGLLGADGLFRIVQEKLPEYGFILRYPKGKENITKIGYEPWHFRYIDSPEIAKEIYDRGICFEEYFSES